MPTTSSSSSSPLSLASLSPSSSALLLAASSSAACALVASKFARDIAGRSSQLTAGPAPTLPTIGGTSSGPAFSTISASCVGESCGGGGASLRRGFGAGDSSYTAPNEYLPTRTFIGGTSSGPALAMISSSSSGVSAGASGGAGGSCAATGGRAGRGAGVN